MRRLGREERGGVLALTAVLMFSIMGITAFAIDLSNWYQARKQLQAAADAAALAGVQDLPSNSTTASTDAQSYVSKNVSGATTTVTTPYQSNSSEIKVTVSKTVPSIFGGILGIGSANITASAAAKASASTTTSAVFTNDTSCGGTGLQMSDNGVTINGGIHSNGTLLIQSNSSTFGATTYGGPNNCSSTVSGGNRFSSGPTRDSNDEPWPYDYSAHTPACTYSATNYTWSLNGGVIPPGVYCASGTITISGNNTSCAACTFIADKFVLTANNVSFTATPGTNNLLFYQTGSCDMTIQTNSFVSGSIFAPNATVIWNANNSNASGFIESKDLILQGNSFTMTGTGPAMSGSGGGGGLIE